MNILTMCQGGNSRSVSCAYVLKYFYGVDALACGWEKNSEDTLETLFTWADAIIIMQKEFSKYVPQQYREKLFALDVGPDRWCNGLHPELVEICGTGIDVLLPHIKEFVEKKKNGEFKPALPY